MNPNYYTENKNHKIFLIVHPLTKEFFVRFTTTKSLDWIFSFHWNLRNRYTRSLFQTYRDTIYPPEIYLLEEDTMTASAAYVRVILWIKYFIAHDYKCLNDSADIEAATDLYEENINAYSVIANFSLEDVLSKDKQRCLNYDIQRSKRLNKDKKQERKQMKFFCDLEEEQLIRALAIQNGRSVSGYLREVALQGFVLKIDYESIREHTKQISLLKNEVSRMIKFFVHTNQVYPADIKMIIALLEQIRDSEDAIHTSFRKELTAKRKMIKRMIQNNISDTKK